MRVSVKAIIIRDGKLLTLHCHHQDATPFYILPGGGQEPGETLHDTLIRECREEIGVDVIPGDLRFVRDHMHKLDEDPKSRQQVELMFGAEVAEGHEPTVGAAPDRYQQGIAWLSVDQLEEYCFYPLTLRGMLRRTDQDALPVYMGAVG